MDIDYGPALPPRLDSHGHVNDASAFNVSAVEEPSRLPSAQPKKTYHSSKQYAVAPSCASDHYSDHSDEPRPAPSRAKKHTDKSKHKSRSRYLPSSSEEDQSPEARHRSPEPSRKTYSDQDHPQHDLDPPYYREVALSHIPSQYAEEVDTFRRILKLPNPRDSLPRSSTAVMGLDDEKGRQIYPKVNISELLHPLPSGTRWDNLVTRIRCKNSIQTLPRSVFLLSPLGPLWARFPCQFSRNWNIRLDRTYPPSTSLPPLPRLLRPVTPLWKSANIV